MADAHQQHVINEIIAIGRARRMPRKAILAALVTGSVESRFRNLKGGDRDSEGWRQERRSFYSNPRNLRASINRFYNEWEADAKGRGLTVGQQAQAVQQSAFPDRYQQRVGLAKRLFRRSGRSASSGTVGVSGTPPRVQPGGKKTDYGAALVDTLLTNRGRPGGLMRAIEAAETNPAYTTTTAPKIVGGKTRKYKVPAAGPGDIAGVIRKDGWKGSKSAGQAIGLGAIMRATGNVATSKKRSTVKTSSGNVSDHYAGNRDSFAWDISGGDMDGAAHRIARQLGIRNYRPGSIVNVTKKIGGRTYRFQLIWGTSDHRDHVHLGVDRVDVPG